jgi:hypothetical protein
VPLEGLFGRVPPGYQVVVVDEGLGRCPRGARRDCYSGVRVVVVVHWGQGIGLQLDGPFPIVPLGSEAGGRVCLGIGQERFGIGEQFG